MCYDKKKYLLSTVTDLEKAGQAIENIKTCKAEEVNRYVTDFVRTFLFLSSDNILQCTQQLYSWAETAANAQPAKLYHAERLIALAYQLCNVHDKALQYVNFSQKHFEEISEPEGVALCIELRGGIYRTMGNFELAMKYSWQAYAVLKHSKEFKLFLCACLNTMAHVSMELHNYDDAAKWFMECLEESTTINLDYFRVYALHGLGNVSIAQNKFPDAKTYFEKALLVAEESKLPTSIGNALTELAHYYFLSGLYGEAERLNTDALTLRKRNNFIGAAVTNCIHLGEIYIKIEKWENALQILDEGLVMAEEIKVRPKIYMIHRLLSKIFRGRGDLAKALSHFEMFHDIREQVEKEDYARKLADARLLFEAEQTRKENIVIKKQKEEIERKNTELQETIDELTITRISRKAKALTLIIAIVLFILEDAILYFALHLVGDSGYFISLIVKMVIIFSLSPINMSIEKTLVKKVIRRKKIIAEAAIPALQSIGEP